MIELNGEVMFCMGFPNKEIMLDVKSQRINQIFFRYESDADLARLWMLKKELGEAKCILYVAYMPYSRMDRREGYGFSLKHVAQMINDLNFDEVIILEPHSDVTPALVDNCTVMQGTKGLLHTVINEGNLRFDVSRDTICFPDASAAKRYHGILDCNTVTMQKHRDFKTGKLKSMEMHGDVWGDTNVVIVDDLCSAGGTFQWAADILKGAGATKVSLVVAHCEPIVLKGLRADSNQLDLIVTTNSIIQWTDVAAYPSVYIYDFKKVMI